MQIYKALGPSGPQADEAVNPRVEPIVKLLCLMMLATSIIIIFCEFFFPMDGQIFTVFAGLLGNISGALIMRIKPRGTEPAPDDSNSNPTIRTRTTTDRAGGTVQETQVGKEPAVPSITSPTVPTVPPSVLPAGG